MDETKLVAVLCGSRTAHDKLKNGIGLDTQDFSEAARCLVTAAGEQYRRDADLQAVDYDTLRSQITRKFGAGSMADSVMEFTTRFPSNLSTINVMEEYRLLRLERCATTLATLLATGQHGEATQDLLAKYTRLAGGEEADAFKARLTADDFEDYEEERIEISPRSLNDFIGGGLRRGHNITVYGRPESGKSMFALNLAAGACKAGYKVLYVANEEPDTEITLRLIARLSNRPMDVLTNQPETRRIAFMKAREPYKNWTLLHQPGCTARDIARQCARLRPDIVVVDQLKNLTVSNQDENWSLNLDRLARQVREIGINYGCVTVSVTQAGDSAEQKLVLQMNDIEWSNTGIPGAADLMVGIGVDHEFDATGKRMLSIPKNKVNGQHGAFPVWVDCTMTKFMSKAKG